MRFMLLIAVNPQAWDGLSDVTRKQMHQDYLDFTAGLRESGALVSGEGLQPTDTATSVRVRDGRRTTTDGPFAESKEVLVGYYLVDVESLDDALDLAAKIPDAAHGTIEVRPVMVWE
jgi:hypothetical protein